MRAIKAAGVLLLDDVLVVVAILVVVGLLAPSWLPWGALAAAAYVVGKIVVFRAHFRRPAVGSEAMEGDLAVALSDLAPEGQVKWRGEIWQARAAAPVRAGSRVRVRRADSLVLDVEPA
ncbi:MAG TPA: NfeD family protein [Candidatus Thermoplasmatota archaeon]|nr:NfeD family protein [Candidatus Thermoplasmatota archaeon]